MAVILDEFMWTQEINLEIDFVDSTKGRDTGFSYRLHNAQLSVRS